jgi:integrase
MALPEFVTRRGERLYYRRAFPKELWPIVGKGAFAMSLRTSDPREALRSRPEAERRYFAKIDEAREELARREHLKPLTKPAAEALAVRWFLSALDTAEDFTPLAPSPEARLKAVEDAEWSLVEARRALAEGDLWDPKRLARCLRQEAGLAEGDGVAEAAFLRLLGRAAVAAEEVYSKRLRGDYGARPADPLFASALEAKSNPAGASKATEITGEIGNPFQLRNGQVKGPDKSIEDLEETFRKVRFPGLSAATQQGYEPVFRLLRETIGADTKLASLTHDEGQRLFEAVQGMPTNAEKLAATKGLKVPEQIAEAKRLGLPTLAPKTINDRYLANLKALFGFAQQRGWMDRNIVLGLRAKEKVGAREARDPFGAPQLAKLLGSAPWSPRDENGGGKPIRFWGPLLALYHGLRLGEVAGLEVRDIAEEGGHPMLLIRSGKRQLKTAAAKRDIPLHPELVRLGFLDFVAQRRAEATPDAMLFAGEKAFARDQWGRGLGDWFAKHVRGLKLEGRKLTFHALRHTFSDALREAEVDAPLADYIMGHSQPGVGAIYGGRPSLARLKGAVQAVRYGDLKVAAEASSDGTG